MNKIKLWFLDFLFYQLMVALMVLPLAWVAGAFQGDFVWAYLFDRGAHGQSWRGFFLLMWVSHFAWLRNSQKARL
jgi:hypothetical protein